MLPLDGSWPSNLQQAQAKGAGRALKLYLQTSCLEGIPGYVIILRAQYAELALVACISQTASGHCVSALKVSSFA